MALQDTMGAIRSSVLVQLEGVANESYRKLWEQKIIAIASTDKDKGVRAQAFNLIGEWKMDTAKQTILNAINDSSYAVAGNALDALNTLDTPAAYAIARKMVSSNPRTYLKLSIWTILAQQAEDNDIELFEKYAPFEQGSKKPAFATYLIGYMRHVKSDASFARATRVFAQLTTLEDMKSRRASLGARLAQAANEQKSDTSADDKEVAATATRRLAIVKEAMKNVIAAEKDPAALIAYKKIMKDTFDEE
jgi:hypothetical protein